MATHIHITATVGVWMNSFHTPAELLGYIERRDYVGAVGMLCMYGEPDREKFCDYTRMGEADVTLRLIPRDEQTRLAIKALNTKLDELRALYVSKQQEILEQITKLQAIEYVQEQS